jgi:hypothetical protein
VAGTGGISDQHVPKATSQVEGDHSFDHSRKGFGYLLIETDGSRLSGKMIGVDPDTGHKATADAVTVDLATNRIVNS